MVNPFEPGREEIVHLTSGLAATEEVRSDVSMAKETGEEKLQTSRKNYSYLNLISFQKSQCLN